MREARAGAWVEARAAWAREALHSATHLGAFDDRAFSARLVARAAETFDDLRSDRERGDRFTVDALRARTLAVLWAAEHDDAARDAFRGVAEGVLALALPDTNPWREALLAHLLVASGSLRPGPDGHPGDLEALVTRVRGALGGEGGLDAQAMAARAYDERLSTEFDMLAGSLMDVDASAEAKLAIANYVVSFAAARLAMGVRSAATQLFTMGSIASMLADERGRHHEVIEHADRVLALPAALASGHDVDSEMLGVVHLLRARASRVTGDPVASRRHAERARELLRGASGADGATAEATAAFIAEADARLRAGGTEA